METTAWAASTPGRRYGLGVLRRGDRLPNFLVIGAMKCGTTALHHMLVAHPDVSMSHPKELNYFLGAPDVGPRARWVEGNWHRGLDWYVGHWRTDARARGESSPGYTSPAHPEAAERIRATVPDARLIFLVRDPVERALSQYRHHVRDGTEKRSVAEALLDPGSQYLSRSRYAEALDRYADFLSAGRLLVVDQQDLWARPDAAMATVNEFLDLAHHDGYERHNRNDRRRHTLNDTALTSLPEAMTARLTSALADDTARLRDLTGQRFAHWSV